MEQRNQQSLPLNLWISPKQQELCHDNARKSHVDNQIIDCGDNVEKLGSFEFPASWIGELSVVWFVQMSMHLTCLGVAESNFKL